MAERAKVLVVDDEMLIRWSLRQILAGVGHQVLEAEDGITALNLVIQESPDVVLLDLRLPELDGMAVLRRIQEGKFDCAVVIVSAHCTPEVRTQAAGLGAVQCIQKPFLTEDIKDIVARLAMEKHLSAARKNQQTPT